MATVDRETSILAGLEQRLAAVEPAAFLVPERILRRVIKHDCHAVRFGLRVPHHTSYVIQREQLLAVVAEQELTLGGRELPPTVILLIRPDDEELARAGLGPALLRSWRLLFHARVHLAFQQKIADGKLTLSELHKRIQHLGQTEFNEVRQVLAQEHLLLPPVDDASTYVEFAAFYLELCHFSPTLVPHYFPALAGEETVDNLLSRDIDAATLFVETRLPGADDPPHAVASKRRPQRAEDADATIVAAPQATNAQADPAKLLLAAEQEARLGNLVRAAILRTQAAAQSSALQTRESAAARLDIQVLVHRLQAALAFPDLEAIQWREVLCVLLPRAARGFWTAEARLLYDLQKVCLDFEREIYSVNLVEWVTSLGRLPLKRPLPGHREVLMVKHLRAAARLLVAVNLGDADRIWLTQLTAAVVRRGEKRLRDHFRPTLENALDSVNLCPRNLPERVARHKLIEELLDNIVEQGFLTISDVRDALARNQLKLPDLSGAPEFLFGDKLILLNRRLAVSMGGVYRGAEIYRRWLQRFSSVAFGTPVGRFLTRHLALPFGGAYVILEGLGHLWGVVDKHLLGGSRHHHFATLWSVGILGCFLWGMLYLAPFRRSVFQVTILLGRGLRAAFIDAPAWLLRLPISGPLLWLLELVLKPLIPGVVAGYVALLSGAGSLVAELTGAVVFTLALAILGSRWGRDLQESLADGLLRGWQRVSANLIPGLLRLIIDFFKYCLDGVERLLYTIDEWFRFRSGETGVTLALKASLGLVWFLIVYVIRFAINLLIEPQVNPIKHFPVVTVSHKLLFPLIFPLRDVLIDRFDMDHGEALTLATTVIWCIPGIFGFLVWELKENWRQYQANRAATLRPVMVGSHGETVIRLLRPGFHSGTIPKLFARLRRAERRGRRRSARRYLHALHHVEESAARFAEREFIALLRLSKTWHDLPLEVEHLTLATNRIRIAVGAAHRAPWPDEPLQIDLDHDSGHMVARIVKPAWIGKLPEEQRVDLANALAGFCQLAGVNEVRRGHDAFAAEPISWDEWVHVWTEVPALLLPAAYDGS